MPRRLWLRGGRCPDSNRRARSPARSVRSSGRRLPARFLRHACDRARAPAADPRNDGSRSTFSSSLCPLLVANKQGTPNRRLVCRSYRPRGLRPRSGLISRLTSSVSPALCCAGSRAGGGKRLAGALGGLRLGVEDLVRCVAAHARASLRSARARRRARSRSAGRARARRARGATRPSSRRGARSRARRSASRRRCRACQRRA